ncbi:MAG: amidohydrolase family protein [bacterium]|nr:amidohydrolase family protein [bacterium]
MAKYSIIIRNGHVIDGKRSAIKRADVGIEDDKITMVGDLSSEVGEKEIDARDRYVVPGFIDITSHSDTYWTLFNYPLQESLLWQGVTTIIGGNCGTSLAPLVSGQELEAIQKWTDTTTINSNWQSVEELFEEFERHRFGVNVGTFIGFGTIRRGVVEDINAPASTGEIEKMKFLLQGALQAGAFGLSTSLGRSHEQIASREELVALSEIIAENNSVIKYHLRNEGEGILPALSEAIAIARDIIQSRQGNGSIKPFRTHISHFKILGKQSWPFFDEVLHMVEQAQHDGIPVTMDMFPYTRTGSNLYLLLPAWAREGGGDAMLERLSNQETKKALVENLKELTLHYEKMVVASTFRDQTAIGKTIAELAEDTGLSPEEVILHLLHINNLNVSIFNEIISEEHLIGLAKRPYVYFASDGAGFNVTKKIPHMLPHPRSFGTFPRVLNEFVKEKSILSWEEAIHKMTYLPAQLLGIPDRGLIEKDAYADIVVLHPEKVVDKATYENPLQYAEGVEVVCLNGTVVLENGEIKKDPAGTVIKKRNPSS